MIDKKRKVDEIRHDNVLSVSGAGIEDINGIYIPTEEYHYDLPVYSKSGNFKDRKDDDFFICFDNGFWFISTLNHGKSLDELAKDYYKVVVQEDNIICPEFGWEVLSGLDPPPRVFTVQYRERESECSKKISNLLFSEKFSDFHFECLDGEILHAHKLILSAASPHFSSVFEDGWSEKNPDGSWKTTNPSEIMRLILTYIYTGVHDLAKIAKEPFTILSLAHEYNLSGLVETTEIILVGKLHFKNLKKMLETSVQYELKKLKHSCFSYIKKNPIKTLLDEGFIDLAFKNKELLKELRSFMLDEEIILVE